jgi:hypothetical protein
VLGERGPGAWLLRLRHEGVIPLLDCYDVCETWWWETCLASLADYAEAGKGQPFS